MVYNSLMEINRTLVLASGSPRRLEIMRAHGIEPIVIPADVDETIPEGLSPSEIPVFLAGLKAEAVRKDQSFEDALIIAADTIVYLGDLQGDGWIMGKPSDPEEGFEMLSALRNKNHYVITGVCLIDSATGGRRSFSEITRVTFRDFSDHELMDYLSTDEAYDKAGGYAIQGTFRKYVTSYEVSYENVIGFPWSRIESELKEFIK